MKFGFSDEGLEGKIGCNEYFDGRHGKKTKGRGQRLLGDCAVSGSRDGLRRAARGRFELVRDQWGGEAGNTPTKDINF